MNFDPAELKDRIKATVSMDDVLEMCNIHLPSSRKITSIYNPDEKTPSLHVYKYDFFDFSTGRGGDQITFVMDYFSTSYGKALKFLARTGNDFVSPEPKQKPKELPELAGRFYDEPQGIDDDYVNARQLIHMNWPTVDLPFLESRFGVRVVRHALWVPHFSPEVEPVAIRGIKVRNLYTGSKSSVTGSTFRTALYRAVNLPGEYNSVIVEGESDCWTMTKACQPHHLSVYGLPGGAGLWRDEWAAQIGPGPVTLVFDNDKAGLAARDRARDRLTRLGKKVFDVTAPGGRASEALAEGWNPVGEKGWT